MLWGLRTSNSAGREVYPFIISPSPPSSGVVEPAEKYVNVLPPVSVTLPSGYPHGGISESLEYVDISDANPHFPLLY